MYFYKVKPTEHYNNNIYNDDDDASNFAQQPKLRQEFYSGKRFLRLNWRSLVLPLQFNCCQIVQSIDDGCILDVRYIFLLCYHFIFAHRVFALFFCICAYLVLPSHWHEITLDNQSTRENITHNDQITKRNCKYRWGKKFINQLSQIIWYTNCTIEFEVLLVLSDLIQISYIEKKKTS